MVNLPADRVASVLRSIFHPSCHQEILNTNLKHTSYARILDSTGRLVIPSKLRTLLGFKPGDLCPFYTATINGRNFLCIPYGEVEKREEDELDWALQILANHDIEI